MLLSALIISFYAFSNPSRSSDDGTCRIWDARYSQWHPRIYVPSPSDAGIGMNVAQYHSWFNVKTCSVIELIGSFS